MERSACGVHLLPLVNPLVLSELRVECPLLKPAHFEREARTELLVIGKAGGGREGGRDVEEGGGCLLSWLGRRL